MKKFAFAIATIFVGSLLLLIPINVAAQASGPYFRTYEDHNGGGDSKKWNTIIGADSTWPNLNNVPLPSGASCNRAFGIAAPNWNDCISSVRLFIANQPNTQEICVAFYRNESYTGQERAVFYSWNGAGATDGYEYEFQTGAFGDPLALDDAITSLRWTFVNRTAGQVCPFGGQQY